MPHPLPTALFTLNCIIHFILLASQNTVALPVNATSGPPTSEPVYVPDPSGRGTIGLISSCVVTLFLCVWTAIHPNIHSEKSTKRSRFLRKLEWAALALFAPEFVLWRAIIQLEAARQLRNECNKILTKKQESRGDARDDRIKRWTLVDGYFAIMGGFGISATKDNQEIVTRFPKTLTPQGIRLMAELDLIPCISARRITAKGKVDQLAKAIVCLQAGWMIVQAIARAAEGLPITLIELNTMAHVGCAFLMYAIWWQKPQDDSESVEIPLDVAIVTVLGKPKLFRHFAHEGPGTNIPHVTSDQQSRPSQLGQGYDDINEEITPQIETMVPIEDHVQSNLAETKTSVVQRPRAPIKGIKMVPNSKLEGSPFIARAWIDLNDVDIRDLDNAAGYNLRCSKVSNRTFCISRI